MKISFLGWLTAFSFLGAWSVYGQEKPYDWVIKNALVYDGEALVPIRQDIAIAGDRMVQVGEVKAEESNQVIDAEGLAAAPGFIDIHTHSDFNPFVYANLGNKVLQGVTTEVVGNCGMSAAPIEGPYQKEIANVWAREGVKIPASLPWESFEEYRGEAEFQGLETNFVGLIGHGDLRSAVMGMEPRAARPDEIEKMRTLLSQALGEGAFGVSFGLTYLPGTFANREELVALCQEVARHHGICAFHMRSEGRALLESIQEAIDIGKESKGAKIQISHLKAAGQANWPKIREAFQKIEQAQAEGLQITADAYPYTASFAELGVVLSDKFYQDPNRLGLFKDPAKREEILNELRSHYEKTPVSWDRIRVATVTKEKNFNLQGKTISQIAQELKKTPIEALVDLLADEEFKVSAFYFSQSEDVVAQVLSKLYVALGSDSIADGSAAPHPRAFGTFPKRLSECREKSAPTNNRCWGFAIRQMSALPAQIFGLAERGRIAPGFFADIVLFDPLTVSDRASYENPKMTPHGIEWVFVNGKPVVQKGEYRPAHSGLFLTPEK